MLSDFLRKKYSAYAPLQDINQQFVHILHDAGNHVSDTDATLGDLLGDASSAPSLIVFQTAKSRIFILWTIRCETFTTTTNSRDDALLLLQNFTSDHSPKQTQLCITFNPDPEGIERKFASKHSTQPILAIIAEYNDTVLVSLGIPSSDRESITHSCRSMSPRLLKRLSSRSAYITIAALLGMLACFTIVSILHRKTSSATLDKFHSWIQYNTEGSSGPKYQLAIQAHNASDWNSYTEDNGREWAFRIDDQAIIPAHLMDDDERHYQEWFHKRYPEVSRITKDRDYVNGTWLADPARDLVPVDDLFHFSHCVLALRRYIKAKQTGKHVCGRDIDEEHMHHCLDSFDWWAFPDGEMGQKLENPKRPLWWRTKVCFD